LGVDGTVARRSSTTTAPAQTKDVETYNNFFPINMGRRDTLISKSILRALFHDPAEEDKRTLLASILAFFTFFQLKLSRYKADVFKDLRHTTWQLNEDEYKESFRQKDKRGGGLNAAGDLGYSGSTFFTTSNAKFLIKSLPRPSEYRFFAHDLLRPYAAHMSANPNSLLVRITDFLYSPYLTLGSLLALAPACHIVMENILFGKESAGDADAWETYDLKPITYFYPERDLAGGHLASESTKERLVDTFEDVIRVSDRERMLLLQTLQADTKLLEENNAVDYSLFLVRYPSSTAPSDVPPKGTPAPKANPSVPPEWRLGIQSSDGKWTYRLVVLDFFWAKHRTQAKAMTGLILSFNLFARKGPMSITTNAVEYRKRFLHMVEGIVVSDLVTAEEVQDAGEGQGPSAD
jgi:hypothetical protein